MHRSRPLAALVLAGAVVLAPTAAAAHVTVQPGEVPGGGFAKLAFRTPNERDDAGTVKLEVSFPTDAPLAFFSVRAVPGWTSTVERAALPVPIEVFGETISEAVSKVTWEGGTIPPGGFEEFEVSVGPLPEDKDELVFKALQTYSSGEVVRWIELREPGATDDPEFPAPVLKLSGPGEEPPVPGGDDQAATEATSAAAISTLQDEVDSADRRAGIAIAIGVVAALASGMAIVRRRRSSPGS